MYTLGRQSKTTFLIIESHKLCLEFNCDTQLQLGQPVMLTGTDKVGPWAKTNLQHTCIGHVIENSNWFTSNGNTGNKLTIATRGYMEIFALSNAATPVGPVTWEAFDAATADGAGNTGYNKYGPATDATDCIGWAIDAATAANQHIRILLKD